MSAVAEDDLHFARWAQVHGLAGSGAEFLPRLHYARYLADLLATTAAQAPRPVVLEHLPARCVSIQRRTDGVALGLTGSRKLHADHAVLALGNLPPASPIANHQRVITDPWSPGALDDLDPAEPVLVVGTGLTAVDVLVSLRTAGHSGPITAVSRTGLLPRAHSPRPLPAAEPCVRSGDGAAVTVRGLLRAVRAATESADDWRPVVDGLRPVTIDLWRNLALPERQRFVRHLARWWEVHRHRMAPQIAELVSAALAEGALEVTRGRVLDIRPDASSVRVTIVHGGAPREVEVGAVVLCTGPRQEPHGQPLLRQLIQAGAARPGPLDLGLDVSPQGRLRDRMGRPQARLWALGTIRRGVEWECTAVPELRRQAKDLADGLLDSLALLVE